MDESGQNRNMNKFSNSALALKNKMTPSLTNRVMSKGDPNFFSLSLGSLRNNQDSKDDYSSISNHQESLPSFRKVNEAKNHIISIDQKLDCYLKEIGNDKKLADKNSPAGAKIFSSGDKIPLSPEAIKVLESLEKLRRSHNNSDTPEFSSNQAVRKASGNKAGSSEQIFDRVSKSLAPTDFTSITTKPVELYNNSLEKANPPKNFPQSPVIVTDPFSKREVTKGKESMKDFSLQSYKPSLSEAVNHLENESGLMELPENQNFNQRETVMILRQEDVKLFDVLDLTVKKNDKDNSVIKVASKESRSSPKVNGEVKNIEQSKSRKLETPIKDEETAKITNSKFYVQEKKSDFVSSEATITVKQDGFTETFVQEETRIPVASVQLKIAEKKVQDFISTKKESHSCSELSNSKSARETKSSDTVSAREIENSGSIKATPVSLEKTGNSVAREIENSGSVKATPVKLEQTGNSVAREIENSGSIKATPVRLEKIGNSVALATTVPEERRVENKSSAIKKQKILDDIDLIQKEIDYYEEFEGSMHNMDNHDMETGRSDKKYQEDLRIEDSKRNTQDLKGQDRYQYLYEKGVKKEKERHIISKLMNEMKEEEEFRMCSFRPEIGFPKSQIASSSKDDIDVRTKQWLEKKEAKIREKQLLKLNEELEPCTFHPEVIKYTPQNIIRACPTKEKAPVENSAKKPNQKAPNSQHTSEKNQSGKFHNSSKGDSSNIYQSPQSNFQMKSRNSSESKIGKKSQQLEKSDVHSKYSSPSLECSQVSGKKGINGEIKEIMKIFSNVNNILAQEPSLKENTKIFESRNSQFEFLSDQKTLKKKTTNSYKSAQKDLMVEFSETSAKKKSIQLSNTKENIHVGKTKGDKKEIYTNLLTRSSLMTEMMNEIVLADTIK